MSEAEKTVSAALVEGEELVWFSRPNGGIRGGGFFVLLVAIAPCVLALGVTVFRLGPPYLLPICWVTVLGVFSTSSSDEVWWPRYARAAPSMG